MEVKAWKGIRRFVRQVRRLEEKAKAVRLPEFISQVLAVLPRSRRYRGFFYRKDDPRGEQRQDRNAMPSLEAALKMEAEFYLQEIQSTDSTFESSTRTWRREGDTAVAQLHQFLERLKLGEESGLMPFAETAAGSGTAEAQRGRNAVTISTAHAAKGQQWSRVFVAQFNEEVGFPLYSSSSGLRVAELKEEQRLAYVATSRARDRLVVSYSCEAEDARCFPQRSRFLPLQPELRAHSILREVSWCRQEELRLSAARLRGSSLVRLEGPSTHWQHFTANPAKPAMREGQSRWKRKTPNPRPGPSKRPRPLQP
nr:ATP-dependent DNA helicase SRS2 [Crypthecodinium cohnii]